MHDNFKFNTRHVSIVERSSSVLNSFTSSVESIQAMAYNLKRDTVNYSKRINVHFKKREKWNNNCASTTLNARKPENCKKWN